MRIAIFRSCKKFKWEDIPPVQMTVDDLLNQGEKGNH